LARTGGIERQRRSGRWPARSGERLLVVVALALVLTSCANVAPSIVPVGIAASTGSISGTVTDGVAPIPGVSVLTIPPTVSGVTDAAGRYTLAPVPPQALTVLVEPPGFLSASRQVTVLPGQTARADLTVAAAVGGTIEGRVLEGTAGLPDVRVTTVPATRAVTSALDGSFALSGLTPGTYRVDATRRGFRPASVFATVTPAMVARVVLAPERRTDGAITGVVTDGANPVGSAARQVKITLFAPDDRRVEFTPREADTAPRPVFPPPLVFEYVFSGLPTGQYIVQAELPGFVPGVKEVRVEPPIVGNGDIILSPDGASGAIAGTVTESVFDRPRQGAVVQVGPVSAPPTTTTTTDAAGRYRFLALAPGEYEVSASSFPATTTTLRLSVSGGNTADGSIRLQP
jgi:hypothetical protein